MYDFYHRLHHCMKNGWMKYGISGSILHEEPSAKPTTNVSGTSPHFDLYGEYLNL